MVATTYVNSATGVLKKVLLCRPNYIDLAPIDKISEDWMKLGITIDRDKAMTEHQRLVDIYEANGVEVAYREPEDHLSSMVFARDFGFNLKEGVVIGKFAEPIRQQETALYIEKLEEMGIPIIAQCTEGIVEGGDFWQLDNKTLVIGKLRRSNAIGIENIRQQLATYGYEILEVDSDPRYLHLDMMFNIVGEKTAVAYWEGLPEDFRNYLTDHKYDIVKIEEAGIFKHFSNLQALGNKRVISLKANIEVNRQLGERGYQVFELDCEEILKTGGGPHCMTFPIYRD